MELTQTQIDEWRSNPVTQAIAQKIAESHQEAKEAQSYYGINETIDKVALSSAYNTGIAEGISTLLTIMMGDNYGA